LILQLHCDKIGKNIFAKTNSLYAIYVRRSKKRSKIETSNKKAKYRSQKNREKG